MFGINSPESFLGIVGHSFGGVIATYAAAALGTSCPPLLLASPLFRPRQKVPTWKRLVTATVPRIAPIVQLQLNLPLSNAPQTPSEAATTTASRSLNLDSASARMNEIALEALNDLRIRHAIELTKIPVTILCGEKDPVVDVERIRDVFSLFENESSSLHTIPSVGHEVLTSAVNETIPGAELLKQWIANRGVLA
jgi:alpha-beta hydrolase superfamily lysophospholipase